MELEKDGLNETLSSEFFINEEDVKLYLNCEKPYEERHTCEICNGLCFEKE